MIRSKQYTLTGASNEIFDGELKYGTILQVVKEGVLHYGTQSGPPASGYYYKANASGYLAFNEPANGGADDVSVERVRVIFKY